MCFILFYIANGGILLYHLIEVTVERMKCEMVLAWSISSMFFVSLEAFQSVFFSQETLNQSHLLTFYLNCDWTSVTFVYSVE